jgi:ribosomal protein S18 acetylase RimI-like enzyme
MVSLTRERARAQAIRPMNPFRDWSAVAQLLRVVFQSEVSGGSLPILPDWPWLRWLNPLINLFEVVGMDTPEQMLGYVWDDAGRIVGNATLGLGDAQAGIWLLSNVAVHPSFRRRGIAHSLVDTAINETRRHGGMYLTLQVQSDNENARDLYERAGFRTYERVTELVGNTAPMQATAPFGWQLREPTSEQWAQVQTLAASHLPAVLRNYRHSVAGLFAAPYRRDWRRLAAELMRGTQQTAWCLLDGDSVVGGMVAQAHLSWGTHRVCALVSPLEFGKVEPLLAACASQHMQRYASRRVQFIVPATHTQMVECLRAAGFREARTLELMGLAL